MAFLLLVVSFSFVRYLHDVAKLLLESSFIDFAHYYTYAVVVRLGQNPFDPQAVSQVDALLAIRRAGSAANYPPLFYLLMQPWVLVPFRGAVILWLLASQACLFGALALCVRRFGPPTAAGVAALLFVSLNYQPLVENLALGQINVVLLFLVTLAWWGLRAGRPWIAAASVALCPFIKVQFGLLLLLLWWMRQRRILGRALLLIAVGLGLGALLLGPAHHAAYVRCVIAASGSILSWTANLSLAATAHRVLGVLGQQWHLADLLTLAVDGALLVVLGRTIPRSAPSASPALDWAWALGVTAIPLLSPLTEEHHLVILLFPLSLLLLKFSEGRNSSADMLLLLVIVLLLGSRYSLEQFPVFSRGVLALLATGKLFGTACLAWLLMRMVRKTAADFGGVSA
jgi:hypothetical protein